VVVMSLALVSGGGERGLKRRCWTCDLTLISLPSGRVPGQATRERASATTNHLLLRGGEGEEWHEWEWERESVRDTDTQSGERWSGRSASLSIISFTSSITHNNKSIARTSVGHSSVGVQ
jgi:hypothetical protein